jgi:soluble lytic murein transglycosylase
MKPVFNLVMTRQYLLLYKLIILSLVNFNSFAQELTAQRWQFQYAYEAFKHNNLEKFHQLSTTLADYPLYYYLQYLSISSQLSQQPRSSIETFLTPYGNTYFGEKLRHNWLKKLAQAGSWNTLLRNYTPSKSTTLQCYYAQARLASEQQTEIALEDAKKLWLVGYSQPSSCDPVFEYLYQSPLMNDTLLWERIRLAMQNKKLSLAMALAKRLSPNEQTWFTLWQTMHSQPEPTLASFNYPDLPITRTIIGYGINRLAKKQFDLASRYWEKLQRDYAFSVPQIGEIQRNLALMSVKQHHPSALKWLAAINKHFLNEKTSETRIKLALSQQHWLALLDFITQMPLAQREQLQWRYWLGRALEQTGQPTQAHKLFTRLAKERDYYGFLAADRIGTEYQFNNQPIQYTPTNQARLMKNPSIRAAYEFYQLSQLIAGEEQWLLNARREWGYGIKQLTPQQQAIAAALASRWGWHDRAIMTAATAGYYDDLEVRFPLAYHQQLTTAANQQNVDLAWAYSIVRQESAFMAKVRSRAGALGLMQLMPATGRSVARKLGLKLTTRQDILTIDTNVSLGTAYLRQMLDRFKGNYILATAAYNAGPSRAKRWAAQNNCLPADIWVEMIPFNETRKYVRNVLFYTVVFESRLGQRPRSLRLSLSPYDTCQFSKGKLNQQVVGVK